MFVQFLTMQFLSMFEKLATHGANNAYNDGHRPPQSKDEGTLCKWDEWGECFVLYLFMICSCSPLYECSNACSWSKKCNNHTIKCNNMPMFPRCSCDIIAWSWWLSVLIALFIESGFKGAPRILWKLTFDFTRLAATGVVDGRTGKCGVISGRWSPSVIAAIAKTIVWET